MRASHGAYCVTNFWEHLSADKEKAQARNLADAAKAAAVPHVIWSTLEDTRKLMDSDDTRMPMLQKHYRVPHFDAKAEADAYFAGLPVTYLVTSFYWDNIYSFGLGPEEGRRRRVWLVVPDGRSGWPALPPRTSARCAYGIFKAGSEYIGRPSGSLASSSLPTR